MNIVKSVFCLLFVSCYAWGAAEELPKTPDRLPPTPPVAIKSLQDVSSKRVLPKKKKEENKKISPLRNNFFEDDETVELKSLSDIEHAEDAIDHLIFGEME